jgi:hypothetical protein
VVASALTVAITALPTQAAESTKAARASYIEAADKVCLATKTEQEAAMLAFEKRNAFASRSGGRAKKTTIGSPESVTEYVTVALPFIERQIQQMTLVVPPAEDKVFISSLLNESKAAVAEAKKNPKEVVYNNPFESVGKKYEKYGFTWCGTRHRPSDPPGK